MLTVAPADFRAAIRARTRAAAFHLADPRVSLIDVGLRIQERDGGAVVPELTVRVHVRHKPRGVAFQRFAAANPTRVVDEDRIGFAVDIIEADYRLQSLLAPPARARSQSGIYNPLHGGVSISNEWFFNFGTLGGKVRDRDTGAEMILSAWHVLAGAANVPPNLRIYQPGAGDGGWSRYTVARLTRHAMDAGLDAAVAQLTGTRPLINDQLGIGPVAGVAVPVLGMRVTKSGRTTAVTEGIIDGVEGVQTIPYGRFERTVQHIVHIVSAPEGGQVSAAGDSGAWWLAADSRMAVGLHFAGDDDPEYALAIAMPPVLAALNVDIVTAIERI